MTDEQLRKDLRRQSDLDQFLNYVVTKFEKRLSVPLAVLAIDVWSEVRSLNLKELDICDFRKKASIFTDKKIEEYARRS